MNIFLYGLRIFLVILIIRPYLGYVKVIEMISRRLTKIQKDEILEAYKAGENTNRLAEQYGCSSNTINRTVKTLIPDVEYKLLKERRLMKSKKKIESLNNVSLNKGDQDFEKIDTFNPREKVDKEESIEINDHSYSSDFDEIPLIPITEISSAFAQNHEDNYSEKTHQELENNFEEIAPLVSSFDFEEKELEFEILDQNILPEFVYMIVDKKVELDVKAVSDLPEWTFLPEDELKRNAILLFVNQRAAKRSCSKNQRVIKIPNTSVFEISKSYLISKGITRLILENSIIALD